MPIISGVKTDAITIGRSNIDSQNFQAYSNNDGTLKIARGSEGTLGDILTIDNTGKIILSNTTIVQQDGLPSFACRAWVNFSGDRNVTNTGASTTGQPVYIRASGNVTSVIKNGKGDYTINFTTAMPDANYSVVGMAGGNINIVCVSTTRTISSFTGTTILAASTSAVDASFVNYAVFR